MIFRTSVWLCSLSILAVSVSGGLHCLGSGSSNNSEISFNVACLQNLNETSPVKVACQFDNSSGFKALRMNGIDQHCDVSTMPGLNGVEIACSFAVSTVLDSTFACYSDVSGLVSFNITLLSDKCIPPVNSTIAVSNSTVTFQCNDGFVSFESSRAVCQLQLHTDMETNLTHIFSDWVPITSGCVANISNDTNTPDNLKLLSLGMIPIIIVCVIILLCGVVMKIRKFTKSNQKDIKDQSNGRENLERSFPASQHLEVTNHTDDENLEAETNIERRFPTSQEVTDHAVGKDTDIITTPTKKTCRNVPKSRNDRAFQSSNNVLMVKDQDCLQSHSSPLGLDSNELDEIQDDVLLLLTPFPCNWEILANALSLEEDNFKVANLKQLVKDHFRQHQKNTAVAKLVMALKNMSKSTDHDQQTSDLLEAMANNISSKYNPHANVFSSPPLTIAGSPQPDTVISLEGSDLLCVV